MSFSHSNFRCTYVSALVLSLFDFFTVFLDMSLTFETRAIVSAREVLRRPYEREAFEL